MNIPRKLNWVHLYDKKFKTESLLKSFCYSKLVATINKNNKTNCTICESNKNGHKMETLLLRCDGQSCNSAGICPVRHKITHCLHSTDYQFFKLYEHEVEPVAVFKHHGITSKVKQIIKSLIFEYDITLPKKIEKKLHNKYKEKITDDENERMPNLSQIQNLVKGLRRKFRESNNINDIKEFLLSYQWDTNLSGDEF